MTVVAWWYILHWYRKYSVTEADDTDTLSFLTLAFECLLLYSCKKCVHIQVRKSTRMLILWSSTSDYFSHLLSEIVLMMFPCFLCNETFLLFTPRLFLYVEQARWGKKPRKRHIYMPLTTHLVHLLFGCNCFGLVLPVYFMDRDPVKRHLFGQMGMVWGYRACSVRAQVGSSLHS